MAARPCTALLPVAADTVLFKVASATVTELLKVNTPDTPPGAVETLLPSATAPVSV